MTRLQTTAEVPDPRTLPTDEADSLRRYDLMGAPGHLIRRAEQIHRTLWSAWVGDSITSAQFAILAALEEHPDIDQRTLAGHVFLDSSTLADVCRRLQDRGLIERRRRIDDGRRYVLNLTAAGRDLRWQLTPGVHRVGEELLRGMSASQRTTIMRLLTHVIEHDRPQSGAGVTAEPSAGHTDAERRTA